MTTFSSASELGSPANIPCHECGGRFRHIVEFTWHTCRTDASWKSGPHDCGATHDPLRISCNDALDIKNIDDAMLANAR